MKKKAEDYLNDGIYGVRKPKHAERLQYLGTLRERVVLALTKGQVMSDKGLGKLEEAMQEHRDTKLLINGHFSSRFLKHEKELANKYNIPYTSILDEESDTEIGAVLACDYAIDKENIFMEDDEETKNKKEEPKSLLAKIKQWFFPSY